MFMFISEISLDKVSFCLTNSIFISLLFLNKFNKLFVSMKYSLCVKIIFS